jgi:hypothetical protein
MAMLVDTTTSAGHAKKTQTQRIGWKWVGLPGMTISVFMVEIRTAIVVTPAGLIA